MACVPLRGRSQSRWQWLVHHTVWAEVLAFVAVGWKGISRWVGFIGPFKATYSSRTAAGWASAAWVTDHQDLKQSFIFDFIQDR